MTRIKQLWYYLLIEPLIWIRYAFFQPITFKRDFEKPRFRERIRPMLRLIAPMLLVAYPIALLLEVLLIPSGLIRHTDILSLLVIPLIGIVVGIMFGVAFGIAFGIAGGIAGGIAFGIAGGIAGGITFGIAGGIAGGIAFGIAFGVEGAIGVAFMSGIAGGIVGSVVVVLVGSIAGVLVGSITFGIAFSIAGVLGFIIGLNRIIPFYIISGFSALITYQRSQNVPPKALVYLRRSALYWDELVYLPLPYLERTLLIAYDEQPREMLEVITFIAVERPLQLRAARAAMLEIVMRDLEERVSLKQIADAEKRLEALLL
jgi:hypothetical protein